MITRFAPSPTGYLHIGGLRTALFNYLAAKGNTNKGKFLLRIEDTDTKRNSKEALQAIYDAFEWVGLEYDEVVLQSNRFDIYKEYINKLLNEHKAYKCYMSQEELDDLRQSQRQKGQNPQYDNRYRDFKGEPLHSHPAIRLKTPLSGSIDFHDGIKGDVSVDASLIDDFIISRSNGTPTYNFTVVIDDMLMGISDIIRGDDHLSNTPKQICIYKALNAPLPNFYHIPMILNENGKKLSKRDCATDVLEYKKMGYLPSALLNFLVRLGWSHGDDEVFSMGQMKEYFNACDINKSASAYNISKLEWLNSIYIKKLSNEEIKNILKQYYGFEIPKINNENVLNEDILNENILIETCKDRAKTLLDIMGLINEILKPTFSDTDFISKMLTSENKSLLISYADMLNSTSFEISLDNIQERTKEFAKNLNIKMPKFFMPLRAALIGAKGSVGVIDIIKIIGINEAKNRIIRAIK